MAYHPPQGVKREVESHFGFLEGKCQKGTSNDTG